MIPRRTSKTPNAVTPEAVREIVALDDQPALRNLLITHTYHELATRLARMLGRDNLHWCAYAVWASKTAGRFIRGEEVPRAVRDLLEKKRRLRGRLRELRETLRRVDPEADVYASGSFDPIGEVVGEIALFIAGGNKIVFAELGELFAELLESFADDDTRDPAKLQEFLQRLRPGETRPAEVQVDESRGVLVIRERGGQDMLRSAVESYYEAKFATDAKKKAELLLLGNALSGLHEQIRLQPFIEGGLNAPVDETLYSRHNDALAQRLAAEVLGRAQRVLDRHFRPVGEELTETVREVSTAFLLELAMPGEVLALGEDLPAPSGRPLFPPLLASLENAQLVEVLRRYGADGAGRPERVAAGTGAKDWSDLDQRMRYIFNYFRSRQTELSLLEPPFDAAQTAAILQGEIPSGRLINL